eukprot:4383900-Amphidinium_carterae.1
MLPPPPILENIPMHLSSSVPVKWKSYYPCRGGQYPKGPSTGSSHASLAEANPHVTFEQPGAT